ncbi:acid protease [Suillus clintonianus]|uniref:acid protease n=1 Tax=Suillus clintonianus TaxID=1904413 RepID=UPI001B861FA3|nr:acid protease [Suillus clintonianus]KAG2151441.1 acid protease [Suillus clintonianus]
MSHVVIRGIPFATRLRAAKGGAKELLERDRARAQKFLAGKSHHTPSATVGEYSRRHHHKGTVAVPPTTVPSGTGGSSTSANSSIDVTDSGVTYTMQVGVGNPATQYTLLIDTGSSNTWVGANLPYNPTSSSQDTGNTINVSYGSGTMSGEEYTDTVTLGSLVIQNQGIGVASSAQGFQGVDGILGVGPVDLTQGTVSNTLDVPTVTDNLFGQGTISSNEIGVFYEPSSTANVSNGELTFGGTDSTKYTSSINSVPLTTTSPASRYWGIDQSVSYGTGNTILNTTAGIVDTGTTLLLIATEAFQAYQQATGAVQDPNTGLLTITQQQYNNLQSLYFNIGGVTYEFTPNAQIWPRALNSTLGGNEGQIYLIVSDLGSSFGTGLDFINGFGWLQRFYTVYDTGKQQLGIATTAYTNANTN